MKNKIYSIIALLLLATTYSMTVAQGDAELSLKSSADSYAQGQEFSVDIQLKNPQSQPVISVRSWLNYDANLLEAISIDTANTPFNLAAPGEDEVSHSEGRVKIGRSNITGGSTDAETKVATVKFKVLSPKNSTASIDFYDYQVTELGHTSVNIIDSGFPLNILSESPKSLKIKLNPNAATEPVATSNTPEVKNPPVQAEVPVISNQNNNFQNIPVVLVRPTDLKVNTGNGYVDLKWNPSVDVNRIGFNVYYGNTSGQYSRRRTVGNVGQYRLSDLSMNETYYFAVTAYDVNNNESDYSNEVAVIVGQPLSSTHPFASILQSRYQDIPSHPQNGPLMGWLVLSATGLGASLVYRKK